MFTRPSKAQNRFNSTSTISAFKKMGKVKNKSIIGFKESNYEKNKLLESNSEQFKKVLFSKMVKNDSGKEGEELVKRLQNETSEINNENAQSRIISQNLNQDINLSNNDNNSGKNTIYEGNQRNKVEFSYAQIMREKTLVKSGNEVPGVDLQLLSAPLTRQQKYDILFEDDDENVSEYNMENRKISILEWQKINDSYNESIPSLLYNSFKAFDGPNTLLMSASDSKGNLFQFPIVDLYDLCDKDNLWEEIDQFFFHPNTRYVALKFKNEKGCDSFRNKYRLLANKVLIFINMNRPIVIEGTVKNCHQGVKINEIRNILAPYGTVFDFCFLFDARSRNKAKTNTASFKLKLGKNITPLELPNIIKNNFIPMFISLKGIPSQCLSCLQRGHLARECPTRYCSTCNTIKGRKHVCRGVNVKDINGSLNNIGNQSSRVMNYNSRYQSNNNVVFKQGSTEQINNQPSTSGYVKPALPRKNIMTTQEKSSTEVEEMEKTTSDDQKEMWPVVGESGEERVRSPRLTRSQKKAAKVKASDDANKEAASALEENKEKKYIVSDNTRKDREMKSTINKRDKQKSESMEGDDSVRNENNQKLIDGKIATSIQHADDTMKADVKEIRDEMRIEDSELIGSTEEMKDKTKRGKKWRETVNNAQKKVNYDKLDVNYEKDVLISAGENNTSDTEITLIQDIFTSEGEDVEAPDKS